MNINNITRTIVSAVHPVRFSDDCAVCLKVWFEELDEPIIFLADPFDCERHGKELWIRAMAGEFGPVTIIERPIDEILFPYQPSPALLKVVQL